MLNTWTKEHSKHQHSSSSPSPSLHVYLQGSHWPGSGPSQFVPRYTSSLPPSSRQHRKYPWWTGSDSRAMGAATLGHQHTSTKQRTKYYVFVVVVTFLRWTLWGSPGMCTHTCTCTSTGTLHRVRGLRARPFSITPPCWQLHSIFRGLYLRFQSMTFFLCQELTMVEDNNNFKKIIKNWDFYSATMSLT